MSPPRQRKRNTRLYLFGTLLAVELLMSFSFLGYVHVEPISVTFAYIPVLLAGALLGPAESTALGMVFGLASMWKAGAGYVSSFDRLFSPLSGYPFGSIMLSVGARTMFGLVIGLLYLAARRPRHNDLLFCVITYFGSFIHAFFVYTALYIFFPQTGYTPMSAISSLTGADNIATALFSTAVVYICCRVNRSRLWQQFEERFEKARRLEMGERYHTLSLVIIMVLTLCFAAAVAVYFVNRMDFVLDQSGVALSGANYSDLFHLQIQFLIGILSLMALVIIFLVFNRRYATYMNYESKVDALTGALTRKAFLQSCGKLMKDLQPGEDGTSAYFIMLDVDRFKSVNDRFGHPEGDRVLRETVQELCGVFSRGLAGRMGGDEFALFLYRPVSREELEAALRLMQERLHSIRLEGVRLSCSVGALPVAEPRAVEDIYRAADRLLYEAKQLGRDRFVIGEPLK